MFEALVIAVPLVVLTGGLLWSFVLSPGARMRKALRRAVQTPVAEARDGQLVKLVGTLQYAPQHTPLVAPLSGRACAYHETTVEQKKSSGRSSHWSEIIVERDFVSCFWIDDGSGRALVEIDATVRVLLNVDARFRSGTFNDATETLERFLARHGVSSQGWVFNKTLRYREGVLEEGELVAALGRCHQEPDPEPGAAGGGYREAPTRVRVAAAAGQSLLLSDDPSVL